MKNKVVKAIVLAGGYSKRMGLKIPKQLVKIGNKPILAHTLDVFQRCKRVDSIILVAHKRIIRQCRNLIKRYGYKKVEQLCPGGATRQESVFNALRKIKDCDYVIIHDGVRPFVSQKTILGVIRAVRRFGAVTCAVKATDTIVEAKKSSITSVFCRNKLWHIQTPQAFKFNLILAAHKKASASAKILNTSDDAQLILKFSNKVKIIKGSYQNLKITTPFDLDLAKTLLQSRR